MSIESMNITVPEPPAVGKSKVVCSFCHHRGHRNQHNNPCKLKKCVEYTFCGIKDRHPEYFNKLNSHKTELRKKKKTIDELEAQLKSMEDFTTNNDYHFVKALTPRLYAADPSYKLNKPKLMRDVRLLKQYMDGKIPDVTSNDPEQLRILISKCKREFSGIPDAPNVDATVTSASSNLDISPVKSKVNVYSPGPEKKKKRSRDRKHKKKNKRRKRYYRYSSSDDSSSDDSSSNGCHNTSRRKEIPQNHFNLNTPVFPTMYNPLVNANNTNTVPYGFYAGMRAPFQHLTQLGQTPQFYHPRLPFDLPTQPQTEPPTQFLSYQHAGFPNVKTETITKPESDLSTLAEIAIAGEITSQRDSTEQNL